MTTTLLLSRGDNFGVQSQRYRLPNFLYSGIRKKMDLNCCTPLHYFATIKCCIFYFDIFSKFIKMLPFHIDKVTCLCNRLCGHDEQFSFFGWRNWGKWLQHSSYLFGACWEDPLVHSECYFQNIIYNHRESFSVFAPYAIIAIVIMSNLNYINSA